MLYPKDFIEIRNLTSLPRCFWFSRQTAQIAAVITPHTNIAVVIPVVGHKA